MRPLRRAVPVVLLALLLALAGCNFAGGPNPSPNATPTSEQPQQPPGVQNGTLQDTTALLDAHEATMVESGFESDFRVNATVQSQGQLFDIQRRQQTIVEAGRGEYQYRTTNGGDGPNARFDVWANDSVAVVRAQSGSTTHYQLDEPAATGELVNRKVLAPYLRASTFTVEGVKETGNRTLVTLTATGFDAENPALVPPNATDARNYEATLVVDTEGRVLSFSASADYTIDGEDASMTMEYEILQLGDPSVEKPTWAQEAVRQADDG
jgi:hypothetical protein